MAYLSLATAVVANGSVLRLQWKVRQWDMANLTVIEFRSEGHSIRFGITKPFERELKCVFSPEEFTGLMNYLAANPAAGDVIPGTSGLRKLRWRAKGKGAQRGARVVYYFRDLNMPVFLLAVYTKGQRADLNAAQYRHIEKVVAELIKHLCAYPAIADRSA